MAKINVTIDLDWIGEDNSLDEEIKGEIVSSVVNTLSEKVLDELSEEVEKQISDTIGTRLNEYMDKFFDTPRDITDRWGEVIKEGVTIKSQLKDALDNFMGEKVDSYGKPSSGYDGKTRFQWSVEKYYNDFSRTSVDKAAKAAADRIKQLADEQISKKIGKKMADIIGLSEELGI